MSDLISRKAAIEAMRCINDSICEQQAVDAICDLPTIDLVKWIPTTEKLPSEGKNVLLCSTLFGNVAIGKLIRYNTSCCWEVDHWDCDIEDWQAWMPLPEPWRGEGDE